MATRNEALECVFGPHGNGCSYREAVLEVLERLNGPRSTFGGANQGVTRTLEGWVDRPCPIKSLKALQALWTSDFKSEVRVFFNTTLLRTLKLHSLLYQWRTHPVTYLLISL
jgi:hypothetical protein